VRIESDGADDVGMLKPVDGRAFVLKIAQEAGVSGNLHGDDLIGPDVMLSLPDFAEGSAADALLKDVFANTLVRGGHRNNSFADSTTVIPAFPRSSRRLADCTHQPAVWQQKRR